MLVHGNNLQQKESNDKKYADETSRRLLREIRLRYDSWYSSNVSLVGPTSTPEDHDYDIVSQRVELLNNYKDFIDQQQYAEQFDSRSNLHSSVLEEFMYYLFRDLVADFGTNSLIGKSHAFKDIFFAPYNFEQMLTSPHARIETKDYDFVIGVRVQASMKSGEYGEVEIHQFDIPAVAIECKTYLDKTMLEGSATSAMQLKAKNPNALYIVLMEWIKLTESVNLQKYNTIDQLYVLRKQKNTDREYRFMPSYEKNPIYVDVVWHLFQFVRDFLVSDWQGGVEYGLGRGWLMPK